jgi:hypothetical protein
MNKSKSLSDLVGLGLAAALFLAACTNAATTRVPVPPTASPTAALQPAGPTATETAVPSATTSPLPTAAASTTPTLAPTPVTIAQVSPGWNAYCRKGPGTYYDAITFLQATKPYPVTGRDGLDTWWQVQVAPNIQCWMGDPTSLLEGPVELVPVIQAPPLPTAPSYFENSSHCDPVLNTMTVSLVWRPSDGASGYRIYRNGDLITELGPKATAYTEEAAPRFVDLQYQIEAFNAYGVSPRLSQTIGACR